MDTTHGGRTLTKSGKLMIWLVIWAVILLGTQWAFACRPRITCLDCQDDGGGQYTATAGQDATFRVWPTGCSVLTTAWRVDGVTESFQNGPQYTCSFSFPEATNPGAPHTVRAVIEHDDGGAARIPVGRNTISVNVTAGALTITILPSAGCTVIAGDGGVDDDEPNGNGSVCSSETTDDALCTEQYANSQVAALKIVPDPGHGFRGWTVNGAEIELASSDPLLLTTLPELASLAAILPPGTREANVGTSGCPEPSLAATFRIPVHGNQPEQRVELTEKTENDATFFRTFGGVRLHLTIPEEFRTAGISYEWIAPSPKFVMTNASIAALSSSMSDATLKTVNDTFLGEEFSSETELHDALYETIISFRMTEEGIQHIIQEEEAKGAGNDLCLLDICTVIQDYMELQPDFVQAEKRTEDELFQLVTAMINDARWNSGK